jgi:hypothetical protein
MVVHHEWRGIPHDVIEIIEEHSYGLVSLLADPF